MPENEKVYHDDPTIIFPYPGAVIPGNVLHAFGTTSEDVELRLNWPVGKEAREATADKIEDWGWAKKMGIPWYDALPSRSHLHILEARHKGCHPPADVPFLVEKA